MDKELLGMEAGIPVLLVEGAQALSSLEQGWERLRGPLASPMQSFAWARACVASFHRGHSLSLVVLGELERPLAVAPLVRRERTRPELIGVSELSEPTDFLYSGPETHNVTLACESLRRLTEAGTRCELEQLLGYPLRSSLEVARQFGVPIRLYVPFGHAHLPYYVSRATAEPWIARQLLLDLVRGGSGLFRG